MLASIATTGAGADLDLPAGWLVGLTNPEIAGRLYLSNHTIKTHINRIFAKTGSRDRAAAISHAHRLPVRHATSTPRAMLAPRIRAMLLRSGKGFGDPVRMARKE